MIQTHYDCPCLEKCPLNYAMSIIGGKWKLQIICTHNNKGTLLFNELRKKMDGISNTVLASSLRELEEKAEVCIPPDARDWDDLYRADCLSKEFMDAGLYRGTLYLCETADEKAYHIYVHAYRKNRLTKFTLDFRNRLYSAEVKED